MSFSHFSPAATRSRRIVSRCRPVSLSVARTLFPSRSIPSATRALSTGVVILPKGFCCSSVKVRLQSTQRKRRLPLRFTANLLHVPWQAGQVIVGLVSVARSMIKVYQSGFRTSSGKPRKKQNYFVLDFKSRFRIHLGHGQKTTPPRNAGIPSKDWPKGRTEGRTRPNGYNDARTAQRERTQGRAGPLGQSKGNDGIIWGVGGGLPPTPPWRQVIGYSRVTIRD